MVDLALTQPLTRGQRLCKRSIDIVVGLVGIAFTWPIMLVAFVTASLETRSFGLFLQQRIGRRGRPFTLVKIRTMRSGTQFVGSWTTADDPRITRSGALMRRYKIDELPQLFNLLVGHMSLVGPRPDVPGFADELRGEERIVLCVRPGITGPATLAYRHEEILLTQQESPGEFNRDVLYPDKVRINVNYIRNYSLRDDLTILYETLIALLR